MASSGRSPRQSESKPNGDVEVKTPSHRRHVVALVVASIATAAIAVAVLVPLLCCKDPDKGDTATPDGRDASSSSVNIKATASNEHRFSAISPLTVETRPTVGSLLFYTSAPLSVGSVWINTSEATSEMASSIRSELLRTRVAAEISSSADTITPSHPSPVPNPVISSSVSQTSSSSVRDCFELSQQGNSQSGVYTVNPGGAGSFSVYCDMSTDGGGWTVFQRRQNQTTTFNRNWTDYKNGFGSLWGEFWLGNDRIHRLTHQRRMQLRVDLQDRYNNTKYANYGAFAIGSASGLGRYGYKLTVGSYSGSAGDALSVHNSSLFNAFTKAGGQSGYAKMYNGWWYSSRRWCLEVHCPKANNSNLNGNTGIIWKSNRFPHNSMKRSEMKMRPTRLP